jgi:hypothetical protein
VDEAERAESAESADQPRTRSGRHWGQERRQRWTEGTWSGGEEDAAELGEGGEGGEARGRPGLRREGGRTATTGREGGRHGL